MAKSPVLVTAPTVEPVSIDDLKDHVAVTDAAEDYYIYQLGVAARVYLEEVLWRALCTQTWDQYFDAFATKLFLQKPPLASSSPITSVKYTDTGGTLQTVSSTLYETGEENGIPFLREAYLKTWPADVRGHADSVVVRTVVGYGGAADVPGSICHALKLLVGDMYEHRETVITGTIVSRIGIFDALTTPYRVRHNEYK